MGPTVGLFGFLARVNTVSAENFMHARRYLHVTAGHQGIQAARHISNIRPLKVKDPKITQHNFSHYFPYNII